MIYVDSSVLLSHLLDEQRQPGTTLWEEVLVSSRLTEYEVWVRLNARALQRTHGEAARDILGRLAFLEMLPTILARAVDPFPVPVRTLDALHLASVEFLRARHQNARIASYDARLLAAAEALGIQSYPV